MEANHGGSLPGAWRRRGESSRVKSFLVLVGWALSIWWLWCLILGCSEDWKRAMMVASGGRVVYGDCDDMVMKGLFAFVDGSD